METMKAAQVAPSPATTFPVFIRSLRRRVAYFRMTHFLETIFLTLLYYLCFPSARFSLFFQFQNSKYSDANAIYRRHFPSFTFRCFMSSKNVEFCRFNSFFIESRFLKVFQFESPQPTPSIVTFFKKFLKLKKT